MLNLMETNMTMTESELKELLLKPAPVSIAELCEARFDFIIPSYHRGYRWTEKEVVRLIKDILDYTPEKDGKFYCLQPLVVRHKIVDCKHLWRVIDGQQRLTTLRLLLHNLKERSNI